ncbi:GIY-YIG nuclease family protein [Sodalis ligni]|uniref:GIY-YIG nuclease family protein n=1 Tax=Sodalis ligni TaxID=2697027 RepID=UPI00193EF109|nr:GIY-YIG nuclease family protein [Sodalis ligni]QWA10207.1 GIY-YIG nuclease family protein [Sodalis ligni]
MSTSWYLYLIRTGDGILYTGITTDVTRRLRQHERGVGAKALRGRGPLTLVFHCPAGDRSNALQWEYRIKQLTHGQKEQLVAAPVSALEDLWSSVFPRRA